MATESFDWPSSRIDLLAIGLPFVMQTKLMYFPVSTCVADWIGSGSLFDRGQPDGQPDTTPWKERIGEAVDRAGFVGFKVRQNLSFDDVFPSNTEKRKTSLSKLSKDRVSISLKPQWV